MSGPPSPGLRLDGCTYVSRCKLCNLMNDAPELGSGVYEKVIHQGLSHASVASWLNGRVEVFNAHRIKLGDPKKPPLCLFNEANFSVHFNKHISERDMVLKNVRKVMKTRTERGGNQPPPEVQLTMGASAQAGTEILSSYQAMLEDIAYLRELLQGFKGAQRNKKTISSQELSKIQSTMTTISSMTSSMLKFMTTGGLARTAIQYSLDAQGRAWTTAVEKGLEMVSHKLNEGDLDLFRREITDLMEVALRGIHEDLTKKFSFR